MKAVTPSQIHQSLQDKLSQLVCDLESQMNAEIESALERVEVKCSPRSKSPQNKLIDATIERIQAKYTAKMKTLQSRMAEVMADFSLQVIQTEAADERSQAA